MANQGVLYDLNDLYYFTQVAEYGGFSAAERALDIPRSRLSARIAALEQRLGVRLFHRTTRQVALTEIGARFLVHCQASVAEAIVAQEVIDLASAEPRGIVRISCPVLATQVYLASTLPKFMKQYPQVRVQVIAADRQVDLLSESVDVAMRLRQPDSMDSDLVTKSLDISRRILVASPNYLRRVSRISHPDDLVQAKTLCLDLKDGVQEWVLVSPNGEAVTVKHLPILMCGDHGTLLQAAIEGLGIAMLPDVACMPALAQNQLEIVLPGWNAPELVLHLVFLTRRGMLPSVRALIDFLSDHIPLV